MTISSTTNRVSYAGDGGTTAFSFPHRFLADGDLTVILVVDSTGVETTQTLTMHYTVSGAGDANGGTVTMVTAPAVGETLVIINDPDLTQDTDLADGSALPAESVETVFDRLTIIAQRVKSLVERSFRLPDGDTSGASLELPAPTALNLIRWNADGDELENIELTDASVVGVAEQRVVGRVSGGSVDDLTPAEIIGIIDDVPATLASAAEITLSGTDTYTADVGQDVAAGQKVRVNVTNSNTGTTPTFENTGGTQAGAKTLTTRDGSALWAAALSGPHTLQLASDSESWLVLDPIPRIADSVQATSTNTANAVVQRDANGRAKFADPSAAQDVVTKAHFDAAEQQRAQAWVNFNGTGTVAIRDHYNVSSITDNGTGDYTINFSSDLADTNYAVTGTIQGNGSVTRGPPGFEYPKDGISAAVGSARIQCYIGSTSSVDGIVVDSAFVSVAVFGGN